MFEAILAAALFALMIGIYLYNFTQSDAKVLQTIHDNDAPPTSSRPRRWQDRMLEEETKEEQPPVLRLAHSVRDFQNLLTKELDRLRSRWTKEPQGTLPYSAYNLFLTTVCQHSYLAFRLADAPNVEARV